MKNKPIVIVAGSNKSIFYEIFFKILKKKYKSPLILICNHKILISYMKILKFSKKINFLNIKNLKINKLNNQNINLINIKLKRNLKNNIKIENYYIRKSFLIAFKIIKNGFTNKLINGPINKNTFLNKKYLGITEYISKYFNKKDTGMLIYNKKLSVVPITTHLPIKMVAKKISKKIIEKKVQLTNKFYLEVLGYKPRIAITGLNPHCETVDKFDEDKKIVSVAVKNLKNKKIDIEGPYSADTIFLKANRKRFDVIVGMYHDQVLTPIKTLYEYDAINITMGLPFLRVSPDHGPNVKMVNLNLSNPTSLIRALEFLDKN